MEYEIFPASNDRRCEIEEQMCSLINCVVTDRRLQGPIPPNVDLVTSRYDGVKFSHKLKDILVLLCVCYYSNYFEEFSEYVRYEVGEYLRRNLLAPELYVCTIDRTMFSLIFTSYVDRHPREFYGNILKEENIYRILEAFKIKFYKPRIPKRNIRHRGYRDHGSLRQDHEWIESYDYSFVLQQNDKEQKEELYLQQVDSLVHLLGDWVLKHHS